MSEAKRWWAIVTILFLAMSFFSALGFYDRFYYSNNDKLNEITGNAARGTFGPVFDLIGNLFSGLNDLTSIFFGTRNNNEFSFKIIIGLSLFFILSHALTKGKAKDVVGRYGNAVAALISISVAFFLPVEVVSFVSGGGIGWFVIIIITAVSSYFFLRFLYNWKEHNRFASFIKCISYLLFLVLISHVPSMIRASGFIVDIVTLAVSLISLYAIWMVGRCIFRIFIGDQGDIERDQQLLTNRQERFNFRRDKGAFNEEKRQSGGYKNFVDKGGVKGLGDRTKKSWGSFWGNKPSAQSESNESEMSGSDYQHGSESSKTEIVLPTKNLERYVNTYLDNLYRLEKNLNNSNLWVRILKQGNDVWYLAKQIGLNPSLLSNFRKEHINLMRLFKGGYKRENVNKEIEESVVSNIARLKAICSDILIACNANIK